MKGFFRYGKSICASLVVALLGLGARYGENWLFPSVGPDPLPCEADIFDRFARVSHSLSPQRTRESDSESLWSVAVATNRLDAVEVAPSVGGIAGTPVSSPGSLAQQVIDATYHTPTTVYGVTNVHVPLNRRRGECDPDRTGCACVTADPLQAQSKTEFYRGLKQTMQQAEAKDIFVFVHGFNVSLDRAVSRAAQMAEDMPFHGVMVAFSWQSAAKTSAYLTDEVVAERYFWNLAQLLSDLRQTFPKSVRLHVLAHSMGNRVTLRALNALAGAIDPVGQPVHALTLNRLSARPASSDLLSTPPFDDPAQIASGGMRSVVSLSPNEIQARFPAWASWRKGVYDDVPLTSLILAAPDVDAVEFVGFINGIQHLCQRKVLYASSSDYALEASRRVHGGAWRAGQVGAHLKIDSLHTVNVSGVSSLDPLGHSYYGSNSLVLAQIAGLLRPRADPPQTVGMIPSAQLPLRTMTASHEDRAGRSAHQ